MPFKRDVVYISLDLEKWKAEEVQGAQLGYEERHGSHQWQESGSAAVHTAASTSFDSC